MIRLYQLHQTPATTFCTLLGLAIAIARFWT
jgi:hypothetical protein